MPADEIDDLKGNVNLLVGDNKLCTKHNGSARQSDKPYLQALRSKGLLLAIM